MSKKEPPNPQVTLEKKGKMFNLCVCIFIYIHKYTILYPQWLKL